MKRNEDKIKLGIQQQDKQQPEVTPQLRDQVQEMLAFVTGGADDLARKAKELKDARKKRLNYKVVKLYSLKIIWLKPFKSIPLNFPTTIRSLQNCFGLLDGKIRIPKGMLNRWQ
jgi:hypothetical protein